MSRAAEWRRAEAARAGAEASADDTADEVVEYCWTCTCAVYDEIFLAEHCASRGGRCRVIEVGGTKCVVDGGGALTHVAFRGTKTTADVAVDLMYHLAPLESFEALGASAEAVAGAMAHTGFATAASLVAEEVATAVRDLGAPVVLSGHSLGGALAVLVGLALRLGAGADVRRVVTFGAPPAGDAALAALCDRVLPAHARFTLRSDPIPKLGSGFLPLAHVRDYAHAGRHVELEGWAQTAGHAIHALKLLSEPSPPPATTTATQPRRSSFWDLVRATAAAPAPGSAPQSRSSSLMGVVAAAASKLVDKSHECHGTAEYDRLLRQYIDDRRRQEAVPL